MIPRPVSLSSAQCGGSVFAPSGSWRSGMVAAITSAEEGGFGFDPVEMTCHPECAGSRITGSLVADDAAAKPRKAAVAATAPRSKSERLITGPSTHEHPLEVPMLAGRQDGGLGQCSGVTPEPIVGRPTSSDG